jgi:hypothetical protein
MIQVTIKGLNKLPGALKKEREREGKALNTAIRVAAFARMKELKAALRRGRGIFEPLSYIARTFNSKAWGRLAPNKPLAKMASAVVYDKVKNDPIEIAVGFTGPKVSKKWKYIAKVQQEGFTRPVPGYLREAMIRRAGLLPKNRAARKYLFIRKSTTQFTTPPRPIIEPFWRSKKEKTRREVIENFRRKMRGERI